MTGHSDLRQLVWLRWAVRATLTLGVAVSVAANVLHAEPNLISRAIGAWPPLALLLTVELISRVPVHRRGLSVVRLGAAAVISAIAGWVSYWHMAAVAARYGETGASPYLLPISVDGLILVASVCLVEISGRLRTIETTGTGATSTVVTQQSEPDAKCSASPVSPVASAPAPVAEDSDTATVPPTAPTVVSPHRPAARPGVPPLAAGALSRNGNRPEVNP